MSESYTTDIRDFQSALMHYVGEIFKCSANELILRLEQLNLLNNKYNCLESSSAFGFIIEEFIVSKLDDYTLRHDGTNGYRIRRTDDAVTKTSYDCIADIRNGIRALINVKICRSGGVDNDAVAAINRLYNDYVVMNPTTPKCFLLLKVTYSFCESQRNGSRGERAISIDSMDSFFLDEVDISSEHQQDNRKWSKNGGSSNSGRLKVSEAFRIKHRIPDEQISYENTVAMLKSVYSRNENKDNSGVR